MESEINNMISTIIRYGVKDRAVLSVMRTVPRHLFVQSSERESAYLDTPLHIGEGQTISQPYTAAYMLELLKLKPGHDVLEIGTGSGWNIALIKTIIGKNGRAVSIETINSLVMFARNNLKKLDIDAHIIHDDGSMGCSDYSPYDRIIITAACPLIPVELLKQLKEGGVVVAPVGVDVQNMTRLTKTKENIKEEIFGQFRFVPLIGKYGFRE